MDNAWIPACAGIIFMFSFWRSHVYNRREPRKKWGGICALYTLSTFVSGVAFAATLGALVARLCGANVVEQWMFAALSGLIADIVVIISVSPEVVTTESVSLSAGDRTDIE